MAFRTIYLSGKLSKTTVRLIHSHSGFPGRVSSTGGLFTCPNPNRSHRHCPSSLCRGCLLSACAVGLAFLGSTRLIEHVLQRMWRHFYVQEILGKNTKTQWAWLHTTSAFQQGNQKSACLLMDYLSSWWELCRINRTSYNSWVVTHMIMIPLFYWKAPLREIFSMWNNPVLQFLLIVPDRKTILSISKHPCWFLAY